MVAEVEFEAGNSFQEGVGPLDEVFEPFIGAVATFDVG